jgi:hypothetical protein
MRQISLVPPLVPIASRRRALAVSGAVLSASAIALLAGRDALAAGSKADAKALESDVRILNTALGAEFEAVGEVTVHFPRGKAQGGG